MIELKNKSELNDLIKKEKVLLDFYADWCGPCKAIGSILEEIDKELDDLEIVKINTDNFMGLAREYKILTIPNLKLYEHGKLIKEKTGIQRKEELLEWILDQNV